jgi:hypothetical protein
MASAIGLRQMFPVQSTRIGAAPFGADGSPMFRSYFQT